MRTASAWLLLGAMIAGCGEEALSPDAPSRDAGSLSPDGMPSLDGSVPEGGMGPRFDPRSFATAVVSFEPGSGAGFGQERMPDVVLGPPQGRGDRMGSLDVVSLGNEGTIVLELGRTIVDEPGVDFVVFENPFLSGSLMFVEPGFVAVSEDGETFVELPCAFDEAPDYAGCAGVKPVFAHASQNDLDPTDPESAGGDAFDLAAFGVARARFVRIRDAGVSPGLGGGSAGFDLDAIAVVNGE